TEATVPVTPRLNVTVLFAAMGSKPDPLIVMVVLESARDAVLDVIVGKAASGALTVATCTWAPLLWPLTVTLASRCVPGETAPRLLRDTRRLVAVAVVTVPMTPLSKVTKSSAALGLK